MPKLLDMPDLAMEKILENLNFLNIQRLRLTCRHLHNFIDDVNPDSSLTTMNLRIEPTAACTSLFFENENLRIDYTKTSKNKLIALLWIELRRSKCQSWENRGEEFTDMAAKDLERVLLNQRSQIDRLNISFFQDNFWDPEASNAELEAATNRYLTNFKPIFKTRNGPVKVCRFQTKVLDYRQVCEILSLLDSDSLKTLTIWNVRGRQFGVPDTFDVMKLVELEHWKNLKTLIIPDFLVKAPIRRFLHFEDVFLYYRRITMDMVLEVKKAFLTSPHMNQFQIDFDEEEQNFDNSLMRHFGCFYRSFNRHGNMIKKWFYKIPGNAERVLFITVDRRSIIYDRDWEKNLPDGIVAE